MPLIAQEEKQKEVKDPREKKFDYDDFQEAVVKELKNNSRDLDVERLLTFQKSL